MKGLIPASLLAATVLVAPAAAQDTGIAAGDVLLRVRGIVVAPNEDSSSIMPAFPGEGVSVDNSVMPEIDFTYMATDNIGFELIASTTKHSASGVTGTTGSLGELASTWVLPPTLTAQYHFNPKGAIRPYVGAGVNYTIFWNEEASDSLEAAVGPTTVKMDDSFGWAVQAGIDIDITPTVFLNLDVKYIDMDTTAHIDTTAAGMQNVDIDLDPLVFGIGVGIRL
ncbi:OmpW/AlkL family protein [Stakelama tenebrarum]|uniref:OmpW family protein n=1 Tax=Stakelama tenebrarum TaxID=2711215 RepID=A0A6G6YA04_9SPHN|nr:OmpW family outer membrane protein [Sphingosinithalassobacter tenebrarum]QIG81538.1 OmpW family protein [Sphingosinithalassobacter tenebrarum]